MNAQHFLSACLKRCASTKRRMQRANLDILYMKRVCVNVYVYANSSKPGKHLDEGAVRCFLQWTQWWHGVNSYFPRAGLGASLPFANLNAIPPLGKLNQAITHGKYKITLNYFNVPRYYIKTHFCQFSFNNNAWSKYGTMYFCFLKKCKIA